MSLHDRLRTSAQNVWWTWHPDTIRLFTDLDPYLWRRVHHNPIAFLEEMTPDQIEKRAADLETAAIFSRAPSSIIC